VRHGVISSDHIMPTKNPAGERSFSPTGAAGNSPPAKTEEDEKSPSGGATEAEQGSFGCGNSGNILSCCAAGYILHIPLRDFAEQIHRAA
jgi:hypothetical protein